MNPSPLASRLALVGLFAVSGCGRNPGGRAPDFQSLPKIDAHVHLETPDTAFAQFAARWNFRLVTLVTGGGDSAAIERDTRWAEHQAGLCPNVSWAGTFSLQDRAATGWARRVSRRLVRQFEAGAVGVKVWKDIGMTFRNPDGSFLMIDDPSLDPVLETVAREGRTLVAHIAEPKNCWLPLDSMSVKNDRDYFRDHPEYHMALHPDYPSHATLMRARDRMLEKHPDLRVVGAHLGSLEWDVDTLAACLDRHPNFAVDLAARMGHLQVQDRDKVLWFFTAYQNRILYGTDLIVSEGGDSRAQQENALGAWMADWKYLATDDTLTSDVVPGSFRGLKLPAGILKKIYCTNAEKWFKI